MRGVGEKEQLLFVRHHGVAVERYIYFERCEFQLQLPEKGTGTVNGYFDIVITCVNLYLTK